MGPLTIEALEVADPPDAWRAAGFTVDEDGSCRVGSVRLALVGRDHGKGVRCWRLAGIDADGVVDGLATEVARGHGSEAADHPNGTLLIDHLVVATPDMDRTVTALGSLGLEPRRTRETDTYGAPMRQTFFRMAEVILEVIGPGEPAGDGPSRFFGLAFTVDDLHATNALLGEHLGRVKDAVQPGRQIATLRHKELGLSTAIAFMSPEPAL